MFAPTTQRFPFARTTSPHWIEHLPFELLGLRATWREEPGCSPAKLVYGSTLRIPGEFIDPTPPLSLQPLTHLFSRPAKIDARSPFTIHDTPLISYFLLPNLSWVDRFYL